MDNWFKWLVSIIGGALAAFFQQYGLFIVLVAVAVVMDFITGVIKAKATGEGLSSKRAWQGFWKKVALFVGLSFGIFLDYAALTVFAEAGINIGVKMPFALIFACYIVLNESISIAENLVLINPEILPKWVGKLLKVAKDGIEEEK
ncbi:MAG: phage holin family protein [Lachnospiraceae bacterium]|nr:phage holin family protein [Lachnospiraceae bacterium]